MAMTPREEKFIELTETSQALLGLQDEQMGFSLDEDLPLNIRIGTPIWNTTGTRMFIGAMQYEYNQSNGSITPLKNIFGDLDIRGGIDLEGDLKMASFSADAGKGLVVGVDGLIETLDLNFVHDDGLYLDPADGSLLLGSTVSGSVNHNQIFDAGEINYPEKYMELITFDSVGDDTYGIFSLAIGASDQGGKMYIQRYDKDTRVGLGWKEMSFQDTIGGGSNTASPEPDANLIRDLLGYCDVNTPTDTCSYVIQTVELSGNSDELRQTAVPMTSAVVSGFFTRFSNDDGASWTAWVEIANYINPSDVVYNDDIESRIPIRATDLADIDLNTLKGDSSGYYYQPLTALATPENNYPVAVAGALELVKTRQHGDVFQRYTAYNSASVWVRVYDSEADTWSSWDKVAIIGDIPGVSTLAEVLGSGNDAAGLDIVNLANLGIVNAPTSTAHATRKDYVDELPRVHSDGLYLDPSDGSLLLGSTASGSVNHNQIFDAGEINYPEKYMELITFDSVGDDTYGIFSLAIGASDQGGKMYIQRYDKDTRVGLGWKEMSFQDTVGGGSNIINASGGDANTTTDFFTFSSVGTPTADTYLVYTYVAESTASTRYQWAMGYTHSGALGRGVWQRTTLDSGTTWAAWVEVANYVPNVDKLSYQDTVGGGSPYVDISQPDANLVRVLEARCDVNTPTDDHYTVRTQNPSEGGDVLYQTATGLAPYSTGVWSRTSTDSGASWGAWTEVASTTPVGTVSDYAGATAPSGWLICDGATLDSVANPQFANLYSVIGTTFGGTGESDFLVPNLVGNMTLGAGGSYGINDQGGSSTVTLTADQIPSHKHWLSNGGSGSGIAQAGWSDTSDNTDGGETTATGGGLSHDNMPPYVALLKIIKY